MNKQDITNLTWSMPIAMMASIFFPVLPTVMKLILQLSLASKVDIPATIPGWSICRVSKMQP